MIVYLITNKINDKKYVGLDRNKTHRWASHLRRAKRDNPIQLIDRKIKQYGAENFTYEVLAECISLDEMKATEVRLIKELNTYVANGHGYNLTLGGDGCVGFKFKPEQIVNKGDKHYMFGKKQSAESNRRRSETMKKIRATTVNPFTTPEVRAKVSAAAKLRRGALNPNYKHGRRVGVNG